METNDTVISEPCDDPPMSIQTVKSVVYTTNVNAENCNSMNDKYFVLTNTSEYSNDNEVTLLGTTNMNSMQQSENSERFTELCRVCANAANHMISIFEGEGAQHDLCTKIHKYLPIRISENDTLPLYMCYHCASTLLAWHDLLESCLDAEQKLLQMQAEFNSQEEEKFVSTIPGENETADALKVIQIAEPNIIEIESLPEATIGTKDDVPEKSSTVINERSQTEEVMVIETNRFDKLNNEGPNEMEWGEYGRTQGRMNTFNDYINNENDPKSAFPGSKRVFQSCMTSQRMKSPSDKSGSSEISQLKSMDNIQEFHDRTQRKSHEISGNNDNEVINKAKTVMNDRVVYHCDKCDKQLLTRRGYIRHIRIHSDDRPCVCAKCDKAFRITQDLIRHINDVHKKLKRYICDICDRAFANKNAKDDHRRIHTGEKPYACDQCQKTFRTLNSLYVHNRGHTNYKPHACLTCGKCFRTRQQLNNHMTTHTGVKPFPCEFCGQTFSVKSEVIRHSAIHNTGKPFECTICDMKFSQKRYIRNHIRVHHKEQSSELLARLNIKLST